MSGWPTCPTCGDPLPRLWRCKSKRQRLQFCSLACVPRQVRVAGGKKGRQHAMVMGHLRLFRMELKRLQALERITGEELAASFMTVRTQSYDNGYSACESKWRRRMREGKAA